MDLHRAIMVLHQVNMEVPLPVSTELRRQANTVHHRRASMVHRLQVSMVHHLQVNTAHQHNTVRRLDSMEGSMARLLRRRRRHLQAITRASNHKWTCPALPMTSAAP